MTENLDDFLVRFRSQRAQSTADRATNPYVAAAAVLAAIEVPEKLNPLGVIEGSAMEHLKDSLVPVMSSQLGGKWALKLDVRRRALKALGSAERMIEALAANPHEQSGPIQQCLESYVRGTAKRLTEQSTTELELTLQIARWLEGLIPGVPAVSTVKLLVDKKKYVAAYSRLTGEKFRGRESQLRQMREFVGVAPPERLLDMLSRKKVEWLDGNVKPPLMVYGPGGFGKSALIAQFVLQHIEFSEQARFPYVYLDMDNPLLNISDLSTLVSEILRQLSIQYPEGARWQELMRQVELPLEVTSTVSASHLQDLEIQRYHEVLMEALTGPMAGGKNKPFLLVIDTFEEVQYGGEQRAYPLWDLLRRLHQGSFPTLRLVVSGRAETTGLRHLTGKDPEPLEVPELDEAAATGFLEANGITDSALRKSIYAQLRGVPLNLKLAVELFRKGQIGSQGLTNFTTKTWYGLRLEETVIQGALFERYIEHIHDPEARKVAHPGLVLRRITAELIWEVLKEPCKLNLKERNDAGALFEELKKEVALVSFDQYGALQHRSDLRKIMIEMLRQKAGALAEEIHRRAAVYYEKLYASGGGDTALAEWNYHLLQLNQRPSDERALQSPFVRDSLQRSIEELPLESQVYLAGLRYTVSARILEKATREQRDTAAAARAGALLEQGRSAAPDAEVILTATGYRGSDSVLYEMEARALTLMERHDEALELLDEGIEVCQQHRNGPRVLRLAMVRAGIEDRLGKWQEGSTTLDVVRERSERLQHWGGRLVYLKLKARNAEMLADREFLTRVAVEMPEHLRAGSDEQWREYRLVLRGQFRAYGPANPWLVDRGVSLFLKTLTPRADSMIREYLRAAGVFGPGGIIAKALESVAIHAMLVSREFLSTMNPRYTPVVIAECIEAQLQAMDPEENEINTAGLESVASAGELLSLDSMADLDELLPSFYYLELRRLLLAGIHPGFRALMALSLDGGHQKRLDLRALNQTERLANRTIPLAIFLKNAARVLGPSTVPLAQWASDLESGKTISARKEAAARGSQRIRSRTEV